MGASKVCSQESYNMSEINLSFQFQYSSIKKCESFKFHVCEI
jgi:hypothetical protein